MARTMEEEIEEEQQDCLGREKEETWGRKAAYQKQEEQGKKKEKTEGSWRNWLPGGGVDV